MLTTITFFKDKGKAKIMVLLVGIISALLLLAAGGIKGYALYKISHFQKVTGTVTDQSTVFDSYIYTDISYEVEGRNYTKRFERLFSNTTDDGMLDLLCDPEKPSEPEILDYVGAEAAGIFVCAAIFGIFFILFLLNYLFVSKKT